MIEKIWVNTDEEFNKCAELRKEVFVKEQGVAEELDFDGSDKYAKSLLYLLDGRPVATGRLIEQDGDIYIGRVAVKKELRGKGLGAQLVNDLAAKAFEEGARRCCVHAQLHAKDFYAKLGFKPIGDVFVEADIEHIGMVKEA